MNIVPFSFEAKSIRTLTNERGDMLFSLSDVCKVLDIKNPSDAKKNLDQEDVQVIDLSTLATSEGRENQGLSNFEPKSANFVTESGLYQVIFQSRKEEAKRFKKWITSEVIPSIRKTGRYCVEGSVIDYADSVIKSTEIAMSLRTYLVNLGIEGNAATISANQATVKVTGVNLLQLTGNTHLVAVEQEGYYTPTELGRIIGGLSAIGVNQRLASMGLQEKFEGHWEMTEKGQSYGKLLDTGKKKGDGTPVTQLKWLLKVKDLL